MSIYGQIHYILAFAEHLRKSKSDNMRENVQYLDCVKSCILEDYWTSGQPRNFSELDELQYERFMGGSNVQAEALQEISILRLILCPVGEKHEVTNVKSLDYGAG